MTSLINPDDPRWTQFLQKVPHDFYHLPGYSLLEAKPDELPVAYLAENRCLIPFILKPIPNSPGNFDAQTPYGYPGPLFIQSAAEAIATLPVELTKHNVVSAFIRLHPLLNQDVSPFANLGVLVQHGHTVTIDLTKTDAEMWKLTRDDHRQRINKALRAGMTAEIDQEWISFPEFHSNYIENMQRVGADAGYFFPPEYFFQLRKILAGRLHLCVVRLNGEFASGALFSEIGPLMQYHLSATANKMLKFAPAKFMIHFIRSWGRERGATRLHLGGGLGAQADSLFLFKVGFSNWTVPFHTWRLPIQTEVFDSLVTQWEASAHTPAEPITGYFPPYRKPLPSPQN
jgi:hypothetical protein